jgi:hypothetical protein
MTETEAATCVHLHQLPFTLKTRRFYLVPLWFRRIDLLDDLATDWRRKSSILSAGRVESGGNVSERLYT